MAEPHFKKLRRGRMIHCDYSKKEKFVSEDYPVIELSEPCELHWIYDAVIHETEFEKAAQTSKASDSRSREDLKEEARRAAQEAWKVEQGALIQKRLYECAESKAQEDIPRQPLKRKYSLVRPGFKEVTKKHWLDYRCNIALSSLQYKLDVKLDNLEKEYKALGGSRSQNPADIKIFVQSHRSHSNLESNLIRFEKVLGLVQELGDDNHDTESEALLHLLHPAKFWEIALSEPWGKIFEDYDIDTTSDTLQLYPKLCAYGAIEIGKKDVGSLAEFEKISYRQGTRWEQYGYWNQCGTVRTKYGFRMTSPYETDFNRFSIRLRPVLPKLPLPRHAKPQRPGAPQGSRAPQRPKNLGAFEISASLELQDKAKYSKFFRIMDLSKETRELIYAYVLWTGHSIMPHLCSQSRKGDTIYIDKKKPPRFHDDSQNGIHNAVYKTMNITRVSRKIREESLPVFYKVNTFGIRPDTPIYFHYLQQQDRFRMIRRVDFTVSLVNQPHYAERQLKLLSPIITRGHEYERNHSNRENDHEMLAHHPEYTVGGMLPLFLVLRQLSGIIHTSSGNSVRQLVISVPTADLFTANPKLAYFPTICERLGIDLRPVANRKLEVTKNTYKLSWRQRFQMRDHDIKMTEEALEEEQAQLKGLFLKIAEELEGVTVPTGHSFPRRVCKDGGLVWYDFKQDSCCITDRAVGQSSSTDWMNYQHTPAPES